MKLEDIHYPIPDQPINEKIFDIEKWRAENPMNYLKAMFLINKDSNKDKVFWNIYKVTRLHIPKTLFKYYSLTDNINLNDQKLDTLQQKKIFMSNVKYLNDPFDSKAYFYRPDILRKYEQLSRCDGRLIDDFSSFSKVSALTANNINSMPMWAYYANNHTGYCVSYDMKCNTQLSDNTFPVQYTDERIDVTSLMDRQVQQALQAKEKAQTKGEKEILLDDLSLVFMQSLFCNIKHISWSYENEFRCTTVDHENYISAIPKKIFIGMNCPKTYIDRLIKIANTLQIPIYQMYFDELSYEFNLLSKRV